MKIGARVRATSDLLARWRAAGISKIACESARVGGVVDRIAQSEHGWWTTVFVRMDDPAVYPDGSGGTAVEPFASEDLEEC